MKKFFRENFNGIIFLIIGLIILFLITKDQNIEKIFQEFITANYWWIILSMIISVISHFIRALRWRLLIQKLNYKPALSKTFYSLMTGYLLNLILPRAGEISRCVVLGKTENIPFNKLLGTVISERAFDTFCLFLILFFVIALQYDLLKSYLAKYLYSPILSTVENNYILLIIIVASALAVVFIAYLVIKKAGNNSHKDGVITKGKKQFSGLKDGILTIFKMKSKFLFLLYTLILWSLYFLMVYVSFYAISSISHLGVYAALAILALGSIGVAMPVPAGLGTYHFVVITCLAELFFINTEAATSFAYLSHASQMLVVLILGGYAWVKLAINKNAITYSEVVN